MKGLTNETFNVCWIFLFVQENSRKNKSMIITKEVMKGGELACSLQRAEFIVNWSLRHRKMKEEMQM